MSILPEHVMDDLRAIDNWILNLPVPTDGATEMCIRMKRVSDAISVLERESKRAWEPSGKGYHHRIHSNPNAQDWAKFFLQVFPNCGADEGLMIGWFANAMMAAHDHAKAHQVAAVEILEGEK